MNPTQFKKIQDWQAEHDKSDKDFQIETRERFVILDTIKKQLDAQDEAMKPVIQAFSNNKIVRVARDNAAKTITLYTGTIAGVGTILYGLYWIVRHLHL